MFEKPISIARSSKGRALAALAGAAVLALALGARPVSAASVPAHGGTFSCGYNTSGQRVVTANLPRVSSFTSGEQVYWFAEVYKKTSTGLTYIGPTRSRLATAWADTRGVAAGALVPGGSWVEVGTNNILIHGGSLAMPSAGTYQVVGRFWWSSFSTNWTGDFATNLDYPAYNTCTFPS